MKKVKINPGSIVISSGKVNKQDMLETIVTVNTTDKPRHKAVYGIYSHFEENMLLLMESKKRLLILMEILLIIQIIKLKRLKHTILLH